MGFLFTQSQYDGLIALLEQWVMNPIFCKRVCSVMHDQCLSWIMRHGSDKSDELKYNLIWIVKDILAVYTSEEQWTHMTELITPWVTTEVILTRMIEQQESSWLPFIAASISQTPAMQERISTVLNNTLPQLSCIPTGI